MIIYLTTNNIKEKIYVGKHCGNDEKYLGSGKYIKRAIKKYGKENFSRITLEDGITDHDYLCEREIYWINFYDSTNPDIGYNLSKGGRSGNSGHKATKETRNKMSEAHKGENNPMFGKRGEDSPNFGKRRTEESRKNMSEAQKGENHPMYGKHPSEETRNRMSKSKTGMIRPDQRKFMLTNNPMSGKHHTEETCKKISKANSNPSEETCKKMSISAKNRPPHSKETCKKMSESKKGEKNHNFGKHPSDETRKKLSKANSGTNNPGITKKEIVLEILKLLENGLSVTKIFKEIEVSKNTIYKVKNGWYNDIYDLPEKDITK